CMTALVSHPGGSIIATDTRWTVTYRTLGRVVYFDVGGKLRRVPGGWVTGTGGGEHFIDVLRAFADHDLAEPRAIVETLRAVNAGEYRKRGIILFAAGARTGIYMPADGTFDWGGSHRGLSHPPGLEG